jgi:hypothetical protein
MAAVRASDMMGDVQRERVRMLASTVALGDGLGGGWLANNDSKFPHGLLVSLKCGALK